MDFKQNLCAALSNACGMTAEQIGDMLETPPNPGISAKLRVFPVLRQPAAI